MPTSHVALGLRLSIALVLLLPRPAQAFEAKCASPIHQGRVEGKARLQAFRPTLHPSSKPLSPQAAFANEHRSRLGTCKVRLGPAKLGGQPGILITAIDPKQIKAELFCRGATAKDCLVRTTKPPEQSTAWARGFLTKTPIGRGQFAYRIAKEKQGELVIILFGPDLTPYLHQAPAFSSDLTQSCCSGGRDDPEKPSFGGLETM